MLLESCCESIEDVRLSEGADRIELCVDLDCGGLTPPASLVERIVAESSLPAMVLIRSRPGDFVFDDGEVALMVQQIRQSCTAGAAGVVVGSLDAAGTLNKEHLQQFVAAAEGLPVTFHKAFDQVEDLHAAYDLCADAGVSRILTSGGRGSAMDGADTLASLIRRPGPEILVAGGVRADHVLRLLDKTDARELHARAAAIPALVRVLGAR